MRVKPLTLKQANDLVKSWHRHHKPVVGHRFSIGVCDAEGEMQGACIVGRPVARKIDQYAVAEVTRLVTNGAKNACSMLYAAAARICREMGFEKIQTYILETESGTSVKAAGWEKVSETAGGGDWNVKSRKGRRTDQPMGKKHRYERILNEVDVQEKRAA